MTQERDIIWLTQDAHDKFTAELADLKGPKRHEIVERISAARDEGDLKENGGYHAARDELGKLEFRITQLTEMLRNFKNEAVAEVVGFQRVENLRKLAVEMHVDDGADNLCDATLRFGHVLTLVFLSVTQSASAPEMISMSSLVIIA